MEHILLISWSVLTLVGIISKLICSLKTQKRIVTGITQTNNVVSSKYLEPVHKNTVKILQKRYGVAFKLE